MSENDRATPRLVIPAGHPTAHETPHNSEFCNTCCHEAYCTECRWAIRNPVREEATMDKWQELEAVLTEAYGAPDYTATWGGKPPAEIAAKMAAAVRKDFERGVGSDWFKYNPTMAAAVRARWGFKTTRQWREAWATEPKAQA